MLKDLFKSYKKLTKMGIVVFVLLTASAGYFLSINDRLEYSSSAFFFLLAGLYFISSGSFIWNQAQEWRLDQKMKRTSVRPIASGRMSPLRGNVLAFVFIAVGFGTLFMLKPLTAYLALLTVVLYNIFYTLYWKRYLPHGAVFGALPGALPPVIGYSLGESYIFTTECVYLFLLMFLWQMPHFWSLAIKYKEDYKKAGVPVLPAVLGSEHTHYEMGLYMIAYLGLALISPLFIHAGIMYVLFLCPIVIKLGYEFFCYINNHTRWLRFFLWVNLSIIVYLSVPLIDRFVINFLIYQ